MTDVEIGEGPAHDNDWMTTDKEAACPDPHNGGLFRFIRTGKRVFHHSQVTVVPLVKAGQ